MKLLICIILLFLIHIPAAAQETDIVPYLRAIEEGGKDEVIRQLPALKKQHPEDPSIIFLDAVLTENAGDALPLYNKILEQHPESRYADASLYRIYSYHYALGLYSTAEKNLARLKSEYPESPYIKIAERHIPATDEQVSVASREDDVPNIESKSDSQYRFTIQAGAFSNKKNASALADEFRSAGYYTEIKEKPVAGTVFDVVYVGRFKSGNEARDFLNIINTRYKLDGRIVEIDNGK